jgi:hypothetical protein
MFGGITIGQTNGITGFAAMPIGNYRTPNRKATPGRKGPSRRLAQH